jgi:sugar lactone lactonase YvrE
MDSVERLTGPTHEVGESPTWRARENALYWVDIPARRVHRWEAATGKLDAWTAPQMVACIAFDTHGELVAGLETGIFRLRLAPGGVAAATQLSAPVFAMPNMRFNDGRCDRQGRFWAGTMHMNMGGAHPVGNLYRYDARDGLTGPWQHGMLTQNGLAWSPKGDRMYLSDSHPKSRTIWSFAYDTATGVPTDRRVFVDMNQHPGRPDGAAVDIDGCYWTCANDAGLLLRFTPEGKLDRTIALPVKKPSMCAFGGAQFDTLYVTSIRPKDAADLAGQPDAGAVFAVRPGIQGLPETEFGSMQ